VELAGYIDLSFGTLRGHRTRSFLSTLGVAIGIAAVILLTSIGEGTRRYLLAEFTQFGTNILEISPGPSARRVSRPRDGAAASSSTG